MKCSICTHARRAEIDSALVSGTSLRVLAEQFGTGVTSLHRHKKHLSSHLVKAVEAAQIADAGTLLEKVKRLLEDAQRLTAQAEQAKQLDTAIRGIREVRGVLELLGKLSGELSQAEAKIAVAFINGEISAKDLTNAQLQDLLEAACADLPDPQTLREVPLFDEITMPVPENIEAWRRSHESLRQVDIESGKPPRGWRPMVSHGPTAADRFQMLLAAWKRESGEDLKDAISAKDFGGMANIEIQFNLQEPDEAHHLWPQVRLIGYRKLEDEDSNRRALPGKTIDGRLIK